MTTKAERLEMERLRSQFALRWPMFERPAPMSIAEIKSAATKTMTPRDQSIRGAGEVVVAWFINAHSIRVTCGWIEINLIYFNRDDPDLNRGGSASRFEREGAYRSQIEATRALRWALSDKCADDLGRVDAFLAGITA
jgi:hypothetical protein